MKNFWLRELNESLLFIAILSLMAIISGLGCGAR